MILKMSTGLPVGPFFLPQRPAFVRSIRHEAGNRFCRYFIFCFIDAYGELLLLNFLAYTVISFSWNWFRAWTVTQSHISGVCEHPGFQFSFLTEIAIRNRPLLSSAAVFVPLINCLSMVVSDRFNRHSIDEPDPLRSVSHEKSHRLNLYTKLIGKIAS